jgi:Baseplate J-like protein
VSGDGRNRKLDACGCCEPGPKPASRFQPPGLPALPYRIGTHASFVREMLAQLPAETIADGPNHNTRPLTALTTRAPDDPVVALLDAGATALDVLTFYQERIANEGFVRTATERRSVLELARAIGYELRPGVAAGTYLAFTVEDADGAPPVGIVPKGTPVQSVPAQGKQAQTFETTEEIEARAEWNALRPRLHQAQKLTVDGSELKVQTAAGPVEATRLYFEGAETNLRAGDLLLAAFRATPGEPPATAIVTVRRVEPVAEEKRTIVDLSVSPSTPSFTFSLSKLTTLALQPLALETGNVATFVLGQSLSEAKLNALVQMSGWNPSDLQKVAAAFKPVATLGEDEGVFAFRARTAFFGHNAPTWKMLPKVNGQDPPFPNWDDPPATIWQAAKSGVHLDRTVPEIVPRSWAVFTEGATRRAYRISGADEVSIANFALSGRTTKLYLLLAGDRPIGSVSDQPQFKMRTTTAHVQSERLGLAELPIEDPLAAGDSTLVLDGLYTGLEIGRPVVLTGTRTDAAGLTGSEILFLAEVVHVGGYTTLHFESLLQHGYVRDTVTVNANVAHATHGETVREVVGGGDGSRSHQQFTLKRSPLTFVSSPSVGGAASTLDVRVGGVRWDEVPAFFGRDRTDQIFIARNDDEGKTTVTFGDGEKGARLPTGTQNVVATYRSGIGLDGEVDAGSLTLLQAKPLGIRGVTNPVRATGAAGPEQLADARRNAPLTVRTIDRIVSLRDYEDFASAFAGIGKAQAQAVWSGESRIVHITVGGAQGKPVDPTSALRANLVQAIDSARDLGQQVAVASYQLSLFDLAAGLVVDKRFDFATVEQIVRSALLEAFSFDARSFGQPVTAAEVVTAIQAVPGVVAVDLDLLAPVGDSLAAPAAILPAATARWEDGVIAPAELLLLNSAGLTLTEAKP